MSTLEPDEWSLNTSRPHCSTFTASRMSKTAIGRNRYGRRVVNYVVRELSDSSPRRPAAWDRWATGRTMPHSVRVV